MPAPSTRTAGCSCATGSSRRSGTARRRRPTSGVDLARSGRHAGPRQHAPPPVPDAHARPGPGGDALRVARGAVPGAGRGSTPKPSTRPPAPASPSSRCQAARRCSTITTSSRAAGPGYRGGGAGGREIGVRIVASRARWISASRDGGLPPDSLVEDDRRRARRHGAARRAQDADGDGAARGRALLAVLGDEGADGRVGRARPAPRPAAAHASRRDGRGGRVLPRAVRLPAGRVPRGARLARGRRLVRALRPPLGRRTSRASAAPASGSRTARRSNLRLGAGVAPVRELVDAGVRSGSASTARRRTSAPTSSSRSSRRCSSRAVAAGPRR